MTGVQDFSTPHEIPPEILTEEIRRGSSKAEEAFYARYRSGLVLMLERRTNDKSLAEDIAHDALVAVLIRLRGSGIEQPEKLNSFVHQTAKYQLIGWQRKSVNKTELAPNIEEIAIGDVTIDEQAIQEQTRMEVRRLISEMKVPRDRELLYRYYVRDQSKMTICDVLDLSPAHFDRVISRARNRFKKLMPELS